MFSQNPSIAISQNALEFHWKITLGPLLAGAIWDQTDQNKDNTIFQAEARALLAPNLTQWSIQVDHQARGPAQNADIRWA